MITPQTNLWEALVTIDRGTSQIAMIVSEQGRLLGTLTDGDARRSLLRGLTLEHSVSEVINPKPVCVLITDSRQSLIALMQEKELHQIPLLDADGRLVGPEVVDDFLITTAHENWVVIMAGGLGTRLKDLTKKALTPMLPVGSRPLLEIIVLNYATQGFRRFYLAVNYQAELIEMHFGDGTKFGVEIRYLHGPMRMGSAGGLSLLPALPEAPIIVTNADLLTNQDFCALVNQHTESKADATMAVRSYEMQVPYGVVLICPQKVVQLNVSLRHDCLPSRKRPAELVWVAQTGAAA